MKNETRALGFAPLILPFAFSFYAFLADIPGFNMDQGVLKFIGLFLAITLVGLPVAYIYELFIGFRFYQLIKKKQRVNIVTLTLGGVLIADIPMFLIWPLTGSEGAISFALTMQLFSFVGFMIGLNFWVLLNFESLRDRVKVLRHRA